MTYESIFNRDKTLEEYKNTPLFGGAKSGLMDTIYKPYPKLWSLYKELKSLDWSEDEFDFTRCLLDFKISPPDMSDMMIETLGWQWEADSVASQTPLYVLSPFISSTEYRVGLTRITDNECLTPDHQVLTESGWKDIADITLYDKVAQWDYDTKSITFVNPTHIIEKDYDDISYEFTANSLSQKVTKNHRMPLVYPYTNYATSPETRLAKEVKLNGSNAIPLSGLLPLGREMTAQEKLWVAVQADGSLCGEKYTGAKTGKLHYKFGFTKERKIERLKMLADEAGWDFVEYDSIGHNRLFYLYVPKEQYNQEAKTFDWIDLANISYNWGQDFIFEIAQWDGSITESGLKRYISTNKSCIDIAQTIAHLVGMRSHLYVVKPRKNVKFPHGDYCDTKEAYQLSFVETDYAIGNGITKTESHYKGKVHCLTVPSSYFVVKRDNKISITGNCIHSATYSEIVKLSFEDTDTVMEKILSFKNTNERMNIVERELDATYKLSTRYASGAIEMSYELYRDCVIKTIIMMYILERVQFMASFGVTFLICSTGAFQQIGKAVQKICQDELEIHSQFARETITYLKKDEQGLRAINDLISSGWVKDILSQVFESEFEFVDSLFRDGRSIPGGNADLFKKWVLFNGKDVANFLKISMPEYTFPKQNPIPVLDSWIDMSLTQPAPQEEAIASYKVNMVVDDTEDMLFDI